jgi:hypothetical protein
MRIDKPKCPTCGLHPEGTVDTVHGVALLEEPDEDGYTSWANETRMNWNGQRTVCDAEGACLVRCEEGHEWYTKIDHNDQPNPMESDS